MVHPQRASEESSHSPPPIPSAYYTDRARRVVCSYPFLQYNGMVINCTGICSRERRVRRRAPFAAKTPLPHTARDSNSQTPRSRLSLDTHKPEHPRQGRATRNNAACTGTLSSMSTLLFTLSEPTNTAAPANASAGRVFVYTERERLGGGGSKHGFACTPPPVIHAYTQHRTNPSLRPPRKPTRGQAPAQAQTRAHLDG